MDVQYIHNAVPAQIVGGDGYTKSFIDNKLHIADIDVAALLDVAGAESRHLKASVDRCSWKVVGVARLGCLDGAGADDT